MTDIMNRELVEAELKKPIELDTEMKKLYGAEPDGTEAVLNYTLRDVWMIKHETDRIYRRMTEGLPPREEGAAKKSYMTAGGPGAGKTTLVRDEQ